MPSFYMEGGRMIKASVLLPRIHDVVDNILTVYEQGANWGAWNGSAFRLDCIIFVKCMTYWDWYPPEKNKAHGGATYNPNFDWTEINILNHCSNRGYDNFLKARPCAYLYMDGHGGYKIDEFTRNGKTYNVAECTWASAWGTPAKCVYSYVDNNGYRYSYKGGIPNGRWTAHGELYGVEYDIENGEKVDPVTPEITTDVVQKGSKGEHVLILQKTLKAIGCYTGDLDGEAGNYTVKGIKAYQGARGLDVDGSCGPKSWATLEEKDGATLAKYMPVIVKGSKGFYVTKLQQTLKDLGYYKGDVDGEAGNYTDAGIRAFQKAKGLDVDGSFGPASWTALFAAKHGEADDGVATGTALTKAQADSMFKTMATPTYAQVESAANAMGMDDDAVVALLGWVEGEGYWADSIGDPYFAYLSACVVINNIIEGEYGKTGKDAIKKIASWGGYYSESKQRSRASNASKGTLKATYMALKHLQKGIHCCYGPGYKPANCFYDPHFKSDDWIYVF